MYSAENALFIRVSFNLETILDVNEPASVSFTSDLRYRGQISNFNVLIVI